jgi:hypothetical protein
MWIRRIATVVVAAGALVAAGLTSAHAATARTIVPQDGSVRAAAALPRPDHVVVLIDENHAFSQIDGPATYLTSLASGGALFTQSFAITHPSEPNYLALFAGSTEGLSDDSCPHTYSTANLGSEAIAAGLTFTGYSESMPSDGYTGCSSGKYARKHNPWVNFTNIPSADNLRFSRFPTDFTTLPTLSIVVPNLNDDMHDGSVSTGDTWAKNHIDAYAQWAKTHNSLLVVTFDEDDDNHGNQIFTVFYGQSVKVGSYSEHITHYSVLRTLENMYGLACTGSACSATGITDAFM